MGLDVDPRIEPYYLITHALIGIVCCRDCGRDAAYESTHPEGSNENHYDQAATMYAEGWVLMPGASCAAICPACAERRR